MQQLPQKQRGAPCNVIQPRKAYTRSWLGSSARRTTAWKLLALPPSSGQRTLSCAAIRDTCNR